MALRIENTSVPESHARDCDRREFLRASMVAGTGLLCGHSASWQVVAEPPSNQRTAASRDLGASRVIRVQSPKLVSGQIVQVTLLRSFLELGLCSLTGKSVVEDAWHDLLRPEDLILIKFNASGARQLGMSAAMSDELVRSLMRAGWPPEQIMLLEAEAASDRLRQTRRPDTRWQGREFEFPTVGRDSFIAALDEATALINVPFLKTHHLAVMSGCLKNLSHGLIRHPSRFHSNGCDPAIAEIVSAEPIQSKLKLNIVNSIRCVFDHGPEARSQDIHAFGGIMFSKDPVAADYCGFSILNEARALRKLPPLSRGTALPRQLLSAARLRVGRASSEEVEELVHQL